MKKLTFSFDIGYASIGWSVISADENHPEIPKVEGTGVVLFEADSCLASKRRQFRRLRRTIRSRRKRIERIGRILEHYGIITAEERQATGHPAPFFLASRALQKKMPLSGMDIWQLMRWYAHNRGYDGNKNWSRPEEESADDIAKVTAAKEEMRKWGTTTMAETITRILGLDTDKSEADIKVDSPCYKSMNMAFPREIVDAEVRALLKQSPLPQLVQDLIMEPASEHKQELEECGVKFPLRYSGSVLFGQLMPRFDNRIIARCPITWSEVYQEALDRGESDKKARQAADKFAKVPNADSVEFYEYRFARILANLRLEGNPISAEHRQALMQMGRQVGRFTKSDFIKVFESLTGSKNHNLRNYFQITPDADRALVIVPQNDSQRASGRAPYARPVLRQVVAEVLRGEDPTRPMRTDEHDGEAKEADGVLYALQNPDSLVNKNLASRTIDQQTNNHMVRHRMLIFERLLADMVKRYANGNAEAVTQCCVEVGRELKEFSGKTAKQIEMELNNRMRSFHSAVKHLEKNRDALPSGTSISGNLIRKCRIAMDMGWKCPYTGMDYFVKDLPFMEREHIVPHSARNTNALAALVLTWPEVNKMKGKRTALEFVREFQTQAVPGKNNLSIFTESRFKTFVEKLSTKGAPDDSRRCKARKRLLLVEKTPQQGDTEGLGFTEGQMTQSSQLMRLASQVAKRHVKKAKVVMIPGFVTAETRKCWNLMSALAESCPEIIDETTGKVKDKESIRDITHMHHALDAATLGLILHLIPGGENGIVWQAIGKRRLNETQLGFLRSKNALSAFYVDAEKRLHLKDISPAVLKSLAVSLAEKRVVRHIPADMSGAHMEEQCRRLIKKEKEVVFLRARGEGKVVRESINNVIGLHADSKLHSMKAVLRVKSDNYGLALDPIPQIIPHFSVYKKLQDIRKCNGGKAPRVLRTGQLVIIDKHKDKKRNGVWRIASIKNNKTGIALDLQQPHSAVSSSKTHPYNWINVLLATLLKANLREVPTDYTANY